MKQKLPILLLLLAMVIGVNAQSRKTWDFTSGLSDETIANLNEDTTNWSANGTDDDGNVNNWKNNKKPSGVVYANGVEIAELSGIQISGGNGSNAVSYTHLTLPTTPYV